MNCGRINKQKYSRILEVFGYIRRVLNGNVGF